MKQITLIISIILIFLQFGISCSCHSFPDFYSNPPVRDYGKNCIAILDSFSYAYNFDGLTAETGHFTLIDTLTNLEVNIGDPIVVYGQDGLNCGYSVHSLILRDTYLLSLFEDIYKQEQSDTFYLDGCGDFFLNLSKPENQGWTTANLKEKISAIMISSTKNVLPNSSIKIFPNPAVNVITIQSNDLAINNILLFDGLGRILLTMNALKTNNQEVIISQYETGNYLLQIQTEKGIIYRKFIKK